ncbi:MAG: hypothetical protein ACLQU3_05320 [Limisphaerales bacterium]
MLVLLLLLPLSALAGGLPEPGLTMYGVVRNAATGNTRITSGALTWTITQQPSGPSVMVTALLTDIGGQYSYLLRVPFETIVGSATLSPNALQLNSASTSYMRTNVMFTVGANTYPVALGTNLGYFTFTTADRGKMEQVDLTVTAPGLGQPPRFTGSGGFSHGQFQMLMSGTAGQTYTLLTSTNLVTWTPLGVFLCTNSVMTIADPSASNFSRRFYRLGQ